MSTIIVIILTLVIVVTLIGVCIVNAVRIARHMNESVNAFRTRLEDDANAVLDGLLNRPDDWPPRSADGSQSTASD